MNLHDVLLVLHITGGTLGLLAGFWNVVAKKGTSLHRRVGKLFLWAMTVAGVCGIPLAIMGVNPFLLAVGIFSLYLVWTGERALQRHQNIHAFKALWPDVLLSLGMTVSGAWMLIQGISLLNDGNTFGITYLVFAGIGLRMVYAELQAFRRNESNLNYWLRIHLIRMTAGFISASTAFLVVNIAHISTSIPPVVAWLTPTVAITPLIFVWANKNR